MRAREFLDFTKLYLGDADFGAERNGASGVAVEEQPLRPRFQASDGGDDEFQTVSWRARAVRAGRSGAHIFEIVELPDVGAEDMDDRVAGVDQHPVVDRLAFDTRRADAGLATGLDDPFGDGADMRAGTSGGDKHHVGEGGAAGQVDADDALGFRVL